MLLVVQRAPRCSPGRNFDEIRAVGFLRRLGAVCRGWQEASASDYLWREHYRERFCPPAEEADFGDGDTDEEDAPKSVEIKPSQCFVAHREERITLIVFSRKSRSG